MTLHYNEISIFTPRETQNCGSTCGGKVYMEDLHEVMKKKLEF